MNAAILMALAIFVGIPAGAMLVYAMIERYYDRVMANDPRNQYPICRLPLEEDMPR